MGQPERGIKEMEDAHRLDPGNLEVADALAQYYNELGMGARAQQVYLEALTLAPDTPALQHNLCFSHYQAGNWSQPDPLTAGPLPSQASSPAVNHEIETTARPAAPPPAVAAAEMAAAPSLPSPPREASSPARPDKPTPLSVLASQPDPELATGKTSLETPRANPRALITVRELMETNIAILKGNGINNLAHSTRSRLHLEGDSVVAINNFSNFGVDRTVIYYRPDAERVATTLNKKFFPGGNLSRRPGWLKVSMSR